MPIEFTPSPDYGLLRRCTEQARATMANWTGGQSKFDAVLMRRAWKLYHQSINRSR